MGMLYRRKKRDPNTGKLTEFGPYWMKYYIDGRPIQASTKTSDCGLAKKLLKDERLPMQEIADRLGFSEPSNFARFFKQHSGMSPSEFEEGRNS